MRRLYVFVLNFQNSVHPLLPATFHSLSWKYLRICGNFCISGNTPFILLLLLLLLLIIIITILFLMLRSMFIVQLSWQSYYESFHSLSDESRTVPCDCRPSDQANWLFGPATATPTTDATSAMAFGSLIYPFGCVRPLFWPHYSVYIVLSFSIQAYCCTFVQCWELYSYALHFICRNNISDSIINNNNNNRH